VRALSVLVCRSGQSGLGTDKGGPAGDGPDSSDRKVCFNGEALVELADGTTAPVTSLKKGAWLSGGDGADPVELLAIVEHPLEADTEVCIQSGVDRSSVRPSTRRSAPA
jgi:hypothetical protein